jgi:hypothetical protein
MKGLKILLVTLVLLGGVYSGAGAVVAWVAKAGQSERVAHLARLTGLGDQQLAELAGVTSAMEPVTQACKDVASAGAEEVIQYLGPPPADAPAEPGGSGEIGFGRLMGVSAGELQSVQADAAPAPPDMGKLFGQVITTAPWHWGRFSKGAGDAGPPLERARLLVVARPTLLPRATGPAKRDSPMAGMAVMQVAVLDAGSGELHCRGGLAAQVAGPAAVELLALHHLCALGGPALCQATNARMNASR